MGPDDAYLDDAKYDKNRLDAKNSRRKMERPRKRKKESESDGDGGSGDTITDLDNPGSPSIETILNGAVDSESQSDDLAAVVGSDSGQGSTTGGNGSSSELGSPSTTTKQKSPNSSSSNTSTVTPITTTTTAEDLTVKDGNPSMTPNSTPRTPGMGQSPVPPAYNADQGGEGVAVEKWATPSSNGGVYTADLPTSTASSSVRDLEEVMNKHLPALPSDADPLRGGLHSDFTVQGFQKHKSTIQWIGSQHASATSLTSAGSSSGTDALPATHLLRTLYANRESVIRTNVYNPRPQYYSEHHHHHMQTSLLTPPGSSTDPYKDMSPFSAAAPQVAPAVKTPPTTYSLMSGVGGGGGGGYSTNPLSVAMAPNMTGTETYGMTPPSSVSPQEKYASPFDPCHSLDPSTTAPSQLRQYPLDSATHTMPIKPQAYPLPAHANAHTAAYDRSASGYAASGYYTPTASFPGYNHASSPTPAHYRDASKNSVGW